MKKLEILGTGCAKCNKLYQLVEQAATELGIEYKLTKIDQIQEIVARGVMMVPALVVDGEIKTVGKVLPLAELKNIIG